MSISTLISSIDRQTTYPVTQSGSAPDNCGLLCLALNTTWTEQMIHELPTINVNIFMPDGSRLVTISVDMRTVNRSTHLPTNPYCIPLYNLPETFDFSITPLFDESALDSHNAQIETGDFTSFTTSEEGIVDTNPEDYTSLLWTIPTSTFDVTISFDDSNIVAGGGSGGIDPSQIDTEVNGTSTNPVQNKAIYSFVNSSVSTNTAYFVGTYNSVAELEAHADYPYDLTNNDYGFVISTDSAGNTVYNRYKYNAESQQWAFEYALNNSSFTANQWATINSGMTSDDKTKLTNLANVPEITGTATSTGSITWRFTPSADDLTKLQGLRDNDYPEILFTPVISGYKYHIILRKTAESGVQEFTGYGINAYANNTIDVYNAVGLNGSGYIIITKCQITSLDALNAGTAISLASNVVGVKVGDGLTTDNSGNLKTTIVGEIMSETAYSQLATKDKDIYFTYD